jgi:hypothetical protein
MGHWLASLSIRELGPRYVLCHFTQPFPYISIFMFCAGSFLCGLRLFRRLRTVSAKNIPAKETKHVTSPSRGRRHEHGIPKKEIHKETPPLRLDAKHHVNFLSSFPSHRSFLSHLSLLSFPSRHAFISSHVDNLTLLRPALPSLSLAISSDPFPSVPALPGFPFFPSKHKERKDTRTDRFHQPRVGKRKQLPLPETDLQAIIIRDFIVVSQLPRGRGREKGRGVRGQHSRA